MLGCHVRLYFFRLARALTKSVFFKISQSNFIVIISPTHKRTEGRAPVLGSEFTSKDAALQGYGEIAAKLNAKFWTSVTGCD